MQILKSKAVVVLCALFFSMMLRAQEPPEQPQATTVHAPLTADKVVQRMEEKNRERSQALLQFEGIRIYRMDYHGILGTHDAQMVVKVCFAAPDKKEFTTVSQSGSKFIINHIFKRLLQSEQDATNEENRQRTALNTDNYDFTMAGYETGADGDRYVLNVAPKSKNKYLYKGKIWVDGKDFAVVRIDAEPAKNPSFWITKTEVNHRYKKVEDFWLPAQNHTESSIRFGGTALLSIEYKDYKIEEAAPLPDKVNESAHTLPGPVQSGDSY